MGEKHSARSLCQEERQQGFVRLLRVARPTGEDQVVRPIVCRLPTPWGDMIERDGSIMGLNATIGTHGAVLLEEPIAMSLWGTSARPTK